MPPTTVTSHTRKRHITTAQTNKLTSYFSPLPANHTFPTSLDYADSTAYAGTTLSPPVPTEIQSSLLNVGMRVRKAVPEGYKNTLIGFKPKPLVSSQQQTRQQISHAQIGLVPFCGMHKIGGLAVQPQPEHDNHASPYSVLSFDPRLDEDNENDFPLSSQESVMTTASTDSMPPQRRQMNNKRSFSDDEVEDGEEDAVEMMTVPRRMAKARGGRPWARDVKRTVSGEAEMDFGEVDWLVPDETSDGMEM